MIYIYFHIWVEYRILFGKMLHINLNYKYIIKIIYRLFINKSIYRPATAYPIKAIYS